MTELCEVIGTARDDRMVAPATRTLDKRLVHKSCDENVLVSQVEAVPGPVESAPAGDGTSDRTDHFRGVLCVRREHTFFFEHGRGHVPGLYLIEAARQFSIAIAHLFYKVPFDVEFVMTECTAQFRNVANLDDPLFAEQSTSDHVYRKGRLASVIALVVIRQRNLEIARMSGTIVLLSRNQLQYLEQRNGDM
jgi:hypothetical protein